MERGEVARAGEGKRTMQWFKNLKIFSKLLLSFAVVAAIAGGIGGLGLWKMSSLGATINDMYANQVVPLESVNGFAKMTALNRVSLRAIVQAHNLEERRAIVNEITQNAKAGSDYLGRYRATELSDKEKEILPKLESALEQYRGLRSRAIELALQGRDKDAERVINEAAPLAKQTQELADQLVEVNANLAEQNLKTATANYQAGRTQLIILVVVAVAIAIILGVIIGRFLAQPLGELAAAADRMAMGDVNVAINLSSNDEIGRLGDSFRRMAENTRKMSEAAEKMSAGELNLEKLTRCDVDILGKALDNTVLALRTLIEEMGSMAREHDAGDIDVVIDAAKFSGAYKDVAEGINRMVGGHLQVKRKSMACIGEFGRGNFQAPLEKFPGKKAFINETIEQVRSNLKALIADAEVLAKAGVEGRLGTRADASKHQGDFRKIVEGVNKTLDAVVVPIQEVSGILEKMAAGDITVELTKQYSGDFNKLKDAVNSTANQFRAALNQIGSTTTALVTAAEELSRVSQQMSASAQQTASQANAVSAGSEQVSKNVQTVATGAEEMGASIKEIAKNTADASRVATAAVQTAEQTNSTIEKLGQSSAEIGEVIKVITSIAQQTNLLALNATIEAARAGEAGKGFAVVANEVKELAKETAKATEDISRKIEAIQGDTKGAVSAIHEIGGVIAKVNDISNTIASAVEEQSATTSEIGRNLGEAARGAQDIAQNVSGVAEAAATTSAGASETQKAAQSLEQMAAQLQAAIGHFKYERRQGYAGQIQQDPVAYHAPVTGLVQ